MSPSERLARAAVAYRETRISYFRGAMSLGMPEDIYDRLEDTDDELARAAMEYRPTPLDAQNRA